ncbi:MAG: phage holin family protein [Verrucomicrobia bacterium]|nr:phage holin family protein [Verrucomicrobiota bacterium]
MSLIQPCFILFRWSGKRLMRTELTQFGKRWIISTVAVLVAAKIVPGINYDRWDDLVVAALVLGILNSVLRPLILLLSLPLLVLTLGLFTLVINAGMLYLVHLLLPGFHVVGFWNAFFGALIISVVSLFLNTVTGSGRSRLTVHRGRRPPPRKPDDQGDGQGPVIDV